ncbi:MAG: TetR/AcrR family transcriptional regulator [Bacteroidales bacterium]|nr:TetR/AcrR family transcriptional regulator [Bacteroidales bacterium]
MASTDYIIQQTLSLFKKMGIRSVTMDLIAEHLGMSKRTLYELFPNKDDLVKACLNLALNERKQKSQEIIAKSEHIIETFILFMQMHINELKQVNPLFLYDLKKYHPEVSCQKTAEFTSTMQENISRFIEMGKEQELFRADVDSDIHAKLIYEQVNIIQNSDIFPPEKYSASKIFEQATFTFIRGISTEKGLTIIDKYYKKHKND